MRCQRCERFICPACQTESAVGFLCPEDAGISTADRVIARTPRKVQGFFKSDILITNSLLVVCIALWVLQILPESLVTSELAYAPLLTVTEPWRMLTTGFVHSTSSPLHLLFNMYSLWVLGRSLEPLLGRARFAILYGYSLFGGSLAALWWLEPTAWLVGASGAIFGLLAAGFVVAKSLNQDTRAFAGIIAINLVLSLLPGVAWQAHVGGLIVGAAVAFIYTQTRSAKDSTKRKVLLIVLAAALIAATIAGVSVKLSGLF